MSSDYIFTSESVTAGHPDKLCDQISDAIVGHYLRQDQTARVVAECAVSTGILFASVKASADATVDVPNVARQVILDVGYERGLFSGKTCTVMTNLSEAAVDAAGGAASRLEDGALEHLVAQDNVTLFGYACNHTPALMPLPIWLAHRLVQRLDSVRRERLTYLAPDGKCQVGVAFRGQKPLAIHSITLVVSHYRDLAGVKLQEALLEEVVAPVFAEEPIRPDAETRFQVNPEGAVLEGGPALHAGLTGRKTGVDTYGGFSRQSSTGLSGKDPTRIDRVGSYAARHAAVNLVRAGLAEQCEVQLSYTIGLARPVSVRVETYGSGRLPDDELTARVADHFDFRPGGIIRRFDLRRLARTYNGEFYRRLAVYGQVGRTDLALPWESTAEAGALV